MLDTETGVSFPESGNGPKGREGLLENETVGFLVWMPLTQMCSFGNSSSCAAMTTAFLHFIYRFCMSRKYFSEMYAVSRSFLSGQKLFQFQGDTSH